MQPLIRSLALALGLSAGAAYAATPVAVPADAPAGTTGMCKDGTYSSSATKKGACKGHKGVQQWYAAAPAGAAAAMDKPARAASAAPAAAPADAPAGTTGMCKDGTYSSSATKKGACKGHKGVKQWYATAPSGSASAAQKPAAEPSGAAPAVPAAPAAAAAPVRGAAAPGRSATPAAAAPGGGPGMVWVNTDSKVYHCPNDMWYGKTKQGQYMPEAEARAKGNRPERGKACS